MYVPEIWSAKDRLFCHFGPFFALLLQPKDPENENLEKNEKKKSLEILSFYKCVP